MATTPSDLQLLLNAVAEWCAVFKTVDNCSQTRLMDFAGASQVGFNDLGPLSITYMGQPLQVV